MSETPATDQTPTPTPTSKTALVVVTPDPAPQNTQDTPEIVEEEPRVRIEQWAGGRERSSTGQIELLMAFASAQEDAGNVLALASVYEQQFRDYCNAPVVG